MRARYYDPALGRFISEDPAKDGVNWFVYCRNNPVNLVDADGKAADYSLMHAGLAGMALGAFMIATGDILFASVGAMIYVMGILTYAEGISQARPSGRGIAGGIVATGVTAGVVNARIVMAMEASRTVSSASKLKFAGGIGATLAAAVGMYVGAVTAHLIDAAYPY